MIDDIDLDAKAQKRAREVAKIIYNLGKPFGPHEAYVIGFKDGAKDYKKEINELKEHIEKLTKVIGDKNESKT